VGNDTLFKFLRLFMSPPKARDWAINLKSLLLGILVGLFIFIILQ